MKRRGRPKTKSSRPYYQLEAVCEMLEVDPETLRGYERRGLIRLERIETQEGETTAVFTREEFHRARRIRVLTEEMGVNLPGVEIILRLLDRIEQEL